MGKSSGKKGHPAQDPHPISVDDRRSPCAPVGPIWASAAGMISPLRGEPLETLARELIEPAWVYLAEFADPAGRAHGRRRAQLKMAQAGSITAAFFGVVGTITPPVDMPRSASMPGLDTDFQKAVP